MKKCKICNESLLKADTKENRTEHYACRRLKLFSTKGIKDSEQKEAFKRIIQKPNLFRKLFS